VSAALKAKERVMIYVYRREASTGARELADAINGLRYRGTRIPIERKARRGDTIVCWGESLPNIEGIRILNGGPLRSKFQDARRLREAGVSTIEVRDTAPTPQVVAPPAPVTDPALPVYRQAREAAEEFLELGMTRQQVYLDGLQQLQGFITLLNTTLRSPLPRPVAAPAQTLGVWIPRLNNHVGGNDLLNPPNAPNFWVKKEVFTSEFRVHSFRGKSLRAGIKAPREGVRQHDWVRSWDGGWRILYDGISSKKKHREIAHAAVEALGLQFGAVDIGERADGTLCVLEVNRAPGLEGGTIEAYARAIQAWVEGRAERRDQ
jgi:hypothetical protein